MKILRLLAIIILATLGGSALAQTAAYTQSVSFACSPSADVCNGLPLDQGGTWQFILTNDAFSINSNGFFIFGNPGVPGTGGGISNVQDGIPEPPRQNGAVGPEGTLTFQWAASTRDQSVHYTGHSVVTGHEIEHCNQHGCSDQMIVDNAKIYIDSNSGTVVGNGHCGNSDSEKENETDDQ